MKIVQLVDNLFADYVIDTVKAFADTAQSLGLDAYVCAFRHPADTEVALTEKSILGCLGRDDIVVLHMESLDTFYFLDFLMVSCKKVIYYYGGLDPAEIGEATPALLMRSELSYQQLRIFADQVDAAIASTSYHLGLLKRLGFSCPLFRSEPVVPSLVKSAYGVRSKSSGVKVISAGDVIPSRGYEDLLRAFRFYQVAYDPAASLCILAHYASMDAYYLAIRNYIGGLSMDASKVLPIDAEAEDCFDGADVFVSLSRSEDQFPGFVTAMRTGIPIVAYDTEQTAGILADAYLGLNSLDPAEVAGALKVVADDDDLRGSLVARGSRRAEAFTNAEAVKRIGSALRQVMGVGNE